MNIVLMLEANFNCRLWPQNFHWSASCWSWWVQCPILSPCHGYVCLCIIIRFGQYYLCIFGLPAGPRTRGLCWGGFSSSILNPTPRGLRFLGTTPNRPMSDTTPAYSTVCSASCSISETTACSTATLTANSRAYSWAYSDVIPNHIP